MQLGINKETGQEVAIKTIKKSKIETEADLIRIRREVQIMSSVQHPNIIHIYEGEFYFCCFLTFLRDGKRKLLQLPRPFLLLYLHSKKANFNRKTFQFAIIFRLGNYILNEPEKPSGFQGLL